MIRIFFTLLLFGLICSSCTKNKLAESITKTNSVCDTVKTSVEWKYCFTPGTGKKATQLIYYFHGGDGSETDWVDPKNYPEAIRQKWVKNNLDFPSVVTISFGKMWILASHSKLAKSGLFEVVKNEVLPFVEKKILKSPVQERIMMGESMGGFNAGTFALQNPSLFSKVALLCPSVGVLSEESAHDVSGYIKETGAKSDYAEFLIKSRDEYFSSWQTAFAESPLTLLKNTAAGTKMPKLFVSCGDKDEYGFFKGASEFVKMAQGKNLTVTWRPVVDGKHCSLDVDALAAFLDQ